MSADAGSQCKSAGWITTLIEEQIKISMDGWGQYSDNIFIKQLWRSLKQKTLYFHQISDAAKPNGSLVIGLHSTTPSAVTRQRTNANRMWHALTKWKHEKR